MAHSGQRAANLAIEVARLAYYWPTFGVTWGNSKGNGPSAPSGLPRAPYPADSLACRLHVCALERPRSPTRPPLFGSPRRGFKAYRSPFGGWA